MSLIACTQKNLCSDKNVLKKWLDLSNTISTFRTMTYCENTYNLKRIFKGNLIMEVKKYAKRFHDQLNILKLEMFVLEILVVCVKIDVTYFMVF